MPDEYDSRSERMNGSDDTANSRTSSSSVDATGERRQNWDVYRNWLTRAPSSTSRRAGASDTSVYTLKGYRNWAAQVKRSWDDGNSDE